MDRIEILDNAESLFESAGFHLSQRCCARPSCFDFVARKEKQIVFVKIHPNIGNVYENDARGLAALANFLSGSSIIICDKARSKPLEDDTVYSRYGVGVLTLKTLEDTLLNGMSPLIEAGPGGYYVELDGEAIRKKRMDKGLSIGKMAEIMSVSRRTLYGYERGMAKASVSVAYKIEWVLGKPVVKPIDIFQYPEEVEGFFAAAKRIISESRFLQCVIRKLLQFNFAVFQTRRAPFDFVAKNPKGGVSLLGAIVNERDQNFEVRSEELISVGKVVDAQPVVVAESGEFSVDNVPFLSLKDLEKIKCPEDLMAKL